MRRRNDDGVALVAVIGLGLVMMLLVATGLTVVTSGRRMIATGQDASGATDAAYAGVQDYLARINLNSNYVRYGDSTQPFSRTSTLTSLATNPAFGIGGSWATVPGSAGRATYRYEVDSSAYASSGVLRLRSTGRVGTVTRSIVASFRVRGFIDYTYFTDYELQDPVISGAPDSCVKHAWEGRSTASYSNGNPICPAIQFATSDSLNGRVHSNDTFLICGATFTGSVTTANPKGDIYNTCNAAPIDPTIPISRAAELPMPATNTSMRADARCLYTGPTRVTYNTDGTMTVVSPWTRSTAVSGVEDPTTCGAVSALRSTAGATVLQLDSDLLYVQNVPLDAGNTNYWDAASTPPGVTCLGADASATSNGNGVGWSLTTGGTTIRYPLTNEAPASNWADGSQWSTTTPAYGCRNGDLYVKGTVTAPTTAASENYVYVVGDVLYADRAQDVLGLVGQNAVLVWNPLTSVGAPILASNREVDAALLSVAHTFQVQNYDVYNRNNPLASSRGSLTVFGSIAQKFRGPVGTSSTYYGIPIRSGFSKSYSYDPLLGTISPPKFLAPTAISFTLQRYASVAAAYSATGVAQ